MTGLLTPAGVTQRTRYRPGTTVASAVTSITACPALPPSATATVRPLMSVCSFAFSRFCPAKTMRVILPISAECGATLAICGRGFAPSPALPWSAEISAAAAPPTSANRALASSSDRASAKTCTSSQISFIISPLAKLEPISSGVSLTHFASITSCSQPTLPSTKPPEALAGARGTPLINSRMRTSSASASASAPGASP